MRSAGTPAHSAASASTATGVEAMQLLPGGGQTQSALQLAQDSLGAHTPSPHGAAPPSQRLAGRPAGRPCSTQPHWEAATSSQRSDKAPASDERSRATE